MWTSKRFVSKVLRRPLSNVVSLLGAEYGTDDVTNVTPAIISKVGQNLHNIPQHPVSIIKQRVVSHFHKNYTTKTGNAIFSHIDNVEPIVTTEQNFDSLLVPQNHPCRCRNDNYYINSDHVLRSHTSAHQRDFIKMGLDCFLVAGDVYRRDEIDSSHYPVFHQMEGVRLFTKHHIFGKNVDSMDLFERDSDGQVVDTVEKQAEHTFDAAKFLELDLKQTLESLVGDLFGHDIETRWSSCYFPFTHPSYELEIKFKGEWLEVLGSGVMRQEILRHGGAETKVGWAFGLGLDRLAMLLFNIPDIRLLWSKDRRFIGQFKGVGLDPKSNVEFKPYSKYPACSKDMSFWLSKDYCQNDFYEIVRNAGGDMIEKVELIDTFENSTTKKTSHCYRITYRSMDRSLENEEVNIIQNDIRNNVKDELSVELR